MKTGDFHGTIEENGKTYIVGISVTKLKNWTDTIKTKEYNDFKGDFEKNIKSLEENLNKKK
jgi:hypothetical protein